MESGNLALSGIQVTKIPSYLSQNGSFKVKINEQEVELNIANVQAIYYYNGYYYIVYNNSPVQTVPIPYLATKLNFAVKGIQKEICKRCGDEIEYDADEPYCPNCGDYYGSKYVSLLKFNYDIDQKTELEQFLTKLFKTNVKYYKDYWWTIAGGSSPNFNKLQKLKITLFKNDIMAIGIIENPEFEEHHYDDFETYHYTEQGKFIIVKVDAPHRYIYYLFSYQGEPDLTLFNQLLAAFQEELKRREEEYKKREEERKRREEEERKKWENENNIIQEIISKMPSWADGVLIKTKTSFNGEDYDVLINIYPIKKSSWNDDYYTSFEWKPVFVSIPDQYLEKYVQKAILKNGQIVNIKLGEQKGKYTPVSLA